MSYQFPLISKNVGSLNSASYLNSVDNGLYYSTSSADVWFNSSKNDFIEFSIYDSNKNLLSWNIIDDEKTFKEITLTQLNNKNQSIPYTYTEIISEFILYKNKNILINPIVDIQSSSLSTGNYTLSYKFSRFMGGEGKDSLVIKEISPSKKEIKLVPSGDVNKSYESFCLKKIPLADVNSLYIINTKNCPYSDLYESTKNQYKTEVDVIKNIFFLSNDGMFIEFLQTIYEDFLKYSFTENSQFESFVRIQGIRSYFTNFLTSNPIDYFSFDEIRQKFELFTNDRLDTLFRSYTQPQYKSAKQYLFDLFVKYFFEPIHSKLKESYNDKYLAPLKNALMFGNGKYIPILNFGYMDERLKDTDPLTLVVKLQSTIPESLSPKSLVWISNISMVPIVFNCVFQNKTIKNLIKIAPADFTIQQSEQSYAGENRNYTMESLDSEINNKNVDISKKITELNVDYSNLYNFIVFSSAELRHSIFKNKMIALSDIDTSILSLEQSYINSGYTYPYYTSEKTSFENSKDEILDSFDGYESYLYKTGNYVYSNGSFSNTDYVENVNYSSSLYDKNNRDSLVNNTPQHIVLNSDNDEYLIFLSMVGHYFDNLYIYIKSLPTERVVEDGSDLSSKILQEMLTSLGWKIDVSSELMNVNENYLDDTFGGTTKFSAQERIRLIWNRILKTLPQIYKTKGTEECVKLILSCYGIPTTTLSVREYGGEDYNQLNNTTYKLEERVYLLKFENKNNYLKIPFSPLTKTFECKTILDTNTTFPKNVDVPIVSKYNNTNDLDWTIGVIKDNSKYTGKVYFSISGVRIISDTVPIFNGDLFSIMLRQNFPSDLFEYNSNTSLIPIKYDLVVQRNEDSRIVYGSSTHQILTQSLNVTFSNAGNLYVGNYVGTNFVGNIDKILLWQNPILDSNFTDHCNNINSYSFTGSTPAYQSLFFRMNFDSPYDLSKNAQVSIANSNEYYSSSVSASAIGFGIESNSSSIDNCVQTSHSVFPYQFTPIDYLQTFSIKSYGPNKFKNEKIQKCEFSLETRLDPNASSANPINQFTSPDSNQIGIFADPNEYKNKDIFRYFGDSGITSLLADPSQMYSEKYSGLKSMSDEYHLGGNRKVLYNEMCTLYKFYFDKSIFDILKQVIPARANIYTGIVIEPTVLERPKYQYKTINTETGITDNFNVSVTQSNSEINSTIAIASNITNICGIGSDIVYADLSSKGNITYEHIPFMYAGPYLSTDPVFVEYQRLLPNLKYVSDGWVKSYPIAGELYTVEAHPEWPIPAEIFGGFNTNAVPYVYSSSYIYLNNCYFYVKTQESPPKMYKTDFNLDLTSVSDATKLYNFNTFIDDIENVEELSVYSDENGKIIEPIFSGSLNRYLVKKWNKHTKYTKIGDYSKNMSVETNHVYLYSFEILNEPSYKNIVYTTPYDLVVSDQSISAMSEFSVGFSQNYTWDGINYTFPHDSYTFKSTSNSKKSNVHTIFSPNTLEYRDVVDEQSEYYYELTSGYPRNHLSHKRIQFSPESFGILDKTGKSNRFVKSKQYQSDTVDESGLLDNSLPVQTINVSNINVIKTDNVLIR